MPDLVFVDSNILVYAHDRSDPGKHAKAREALRRCWGEETGCLSLQVLQEFYVSITRKVRYPLSKKVARDLIATYSVWPLALLTPDHVIAASRQEERYQLQFWDALIVSAAQLLNAETILSEDFHHGLEIEGISIRNPLL
jgi:predicted nucleic acid-binding protein